MPATTHPDGSGATNKFEANMSSRSAVLVELTTVSSGVKRANPRMVESSFGSSSSHAMATSVSVAAIATANGNTESGAGPQLRRWASRSALSRQPLASAFWQKFEHASVPPPKPSALQPSPLGSVPSQTSVNCTSGQVSNAARMTQVSRTPLPHRPPPQLVGEGKIAQALLPNVPATLDGAVPAEPIEPN